MSEALTDVVVLGAGPAGLSAALMLGRARRRVVVIDSGEPRNRFAAHMHGVLGRDGTDPRDLARTGRAEVQRYGVQIVDGAVVQVEDATPNLLARTADGRCWSSRALIAATGVVDRLPDIPGLESRWGSSVLHCPYCDGWEVRDQRLGVLADGPMRAHYVHLIRQWSDRVTFFAGAEPLEAEDARRMHARGIGFVSSPIVEVTGDGPRLTGVRTRDGQLIELDALFVHAATVPRDGCLAGLDLARADSPSGPTVAVDELGRTSDPRIWAIGNVISPSQNVPMALSAGAGAGAAVNMALIAADTDQAVAALPMVTSR